MLRFYVLDQSGEPTEETDAERWMEWMKDHTAERMIQCNNIGEILVLTIFIGLAIPDGDDCYLFATRVFGGLLDDQMVFYATEAEAREGHLAMLERVRKAESLEAL